jgi:hypothetical protein
LGDILCTSREALSRSSSPNHPDPSVQVFENVSWDAESSNIAADPNPKQLAYIAAARLSAKVRVLLDAYFDNQDLTSPRSNLPTVEYLTAVAQPERLDLQAPRCRPTGQESEACQGMLSRILRIGAAQCYSRTA